MAKKLYREVYQAINKAVTPDFDRWAKKNHGISGKKLLAKVASAEGGGTTKNPNVSSAQAKGPFQFIPSTRAAYIKQHGVDAWKSDTDAAKAAMIHLKGTGIKGYNPGMSSYTDLVLGQDVDTGPLKTGGYGKGGGGEIAGGGSRVVGGDLKGKTVKTPGVDRSADRQALKQSYLARTPGKMPSQNALLEMAGGLQDLQDEPGSSSIKLSRSPRKRVSDGGRSYRGKANLSGRPMDRPGVPTDKLTRRIVRDASKRTPINVGTGSSHSKTTTSGNVSDHWGGKALDLPAKGVQGDHTAGAILMRLGVSRKKARAMAQKGGAHTVHDKSGRRWQVIWKTNVGGNHYDHVHVGHG